MTGKKSPLKEELNKAIDLSFILDVISELVVYHDPKLRILWANKAAADSVGKKPEDMVGRHCYELWHGNRKPCKGCPIIKSMRTGKQEACEMRTPDGRAWLIRGNPVKDSVGRIKGVVEMTLDITEHRKAENELRKAEKRFRDVSLSSADWMWETDSKGKYTYATENVRKILGYSPREIMGRSPFEFMPKGEKERVGKIFRKILHDRKPIADLENWNITKDGKRVCLLTNGVPILDSGRNLLGYRGVDKDVTEQKIASHKLKESEYRYRSLVELSPEGIVTVNMKGVITSCNKTFLKITGYKKSDFVGKHFTKIPAKIPNDIPKYMKLMSQILRGKSPETFEFRLRDREGRERVGECSVGIIETSGGKKEVQVVVRDNTQNRVRERKIAESEERFRGIFESVNDLMIYADTKGIIMDVNRKALEIAGKKREDVVGRHFSQIDILPLKEVPRAAAAFFKSMVGGPRTLRTAIKGKDGEIIPVESSVSFVRKNEKIVGVLVISRDISEKEMSERAIRESESKYRALVEGANEGIVVIQNGTIRFVNPRMSEILECRRDRLLGMVFSRLFHKDYRILLEKHLSWATGNRPISPLTLKIKGIRGKFRWVEIKTVFIMWNGEPATLNFLSDITERKEASEAIKESEERFRSLYSSMSEGAAIHEMVYDKSGNARDYVIIDVNKAFELITGMEREEVIGKRASKIYGTGKPPYIETYAGVVSSGSPVSFETFFEPMKRHLSISVFSPSGGRFVTIFSDITERKKSEEEIRKRTHELERFNRLSIGRELKMVELKKRIKRLEVIMKKHGIKEGV